MVGWIKSGLNWALLMGGMNYSCKLVTDGVPQGLIPRLVLFSIFVPPLRSLTGRFTDSTKWGGVVDTTAGCAAIQRDLDVRDITEQTGTSVISTKGNAKFCTWGWITSCVVVNPEQATG